MTALGVDLDGTLLDHAAASDGAVRAWARARGWVEEVAAGAWLDAERRHFPRFVSGAITFEEQRRRRLRDLQLMVGDNSLGYEPGPMFEEYLVHYRASWVPYADAAPFLASARRAGLRVGVLTNGQREQQESKLAVTGLLDAVDVLVASSDLPAGKPDPRSFATLCSALDADPAQTAFVGDDLLTDVQGAAKAGLAPVWLNRSRLKSSDGWTQAENLGDVIALLTALGAASSGLIGQSKPPA